MGHGGEIPADIKFRIKRLVAAGSRRLPPFQAPAANRPVGAPGRTAVVPSAPGRTTHMDVIQSLRRTSAGKLQLLRRLAPGGESGMIFY